MYNPQLSKLLAGFCELTYQQYAAGPPAVNNGQVLLPAGYSQVASFTAPELDLQTASSLMQQLPTSQINSSKEVAALVMIFDEVYFGFAATSATHNIIALRGTKSNFEWLFDADMKQSEVPLIWYNNNFAGSKAHSGFLAFYCLLADQVIAACKQFNPELPCLVTGHSLGAALSTLMAPSIVINTRSSNVNVYNYASPRLVNPVFVNAYEQLIPKSYRIVNLADIVPVIFASTSTDTYKNIGEEWSFLNQSGTVGGNHALIGPDNYTDAVNKEVPTNAQRFYPSAGL